MADKSTSGPESNGSTRRRVIKAGGAAAFGAVSGNIDTVTDLLNPQQKDADVLAMRNTAQNTEEDLRNTLSAAQEKQVAAADHVYPDRTYCGIEERSKNIVGSGTYNFETATTLDMHLEPYIGEEHDLAAKIDDIGYLLYKGAVEGASKHSSYFPYQKYDSWESHISRFIDDDIELLRFGFVQHTNPDTDYVAVHEVPAVTAAKFQARDRPYWKNIGKERNAYITHLENNLEIVERQSAIKHTR